eukprot:1962199-Lingulodinium_polyedra.AAC.1
MFHAQPGPTRLSAEDILPFELRKECVNALQAQWWNEPTNQAIVRQWPTTLSRQQVYQKLRQGFRAACHHKYGGLDWLHFLLAVGDITQELVTCVNEEVERIVATTEGRVASL